MQEITDEQLIGNYVAGDEGALRTLIERYINPIYGFVRRYVGSDGDAEDITQDIFVSAWKNFKKFDQSKKFNPWIYAIAKNASLNWIKKKRPALFSGFEREEGEDVFENLLVDHAPLPNEIFSRTDIGRQLSLAIGRMRPEYQTVLSLRYADDLTFQEIATSLGESLDTVKSWHRRALAHLKKRLSP